MNENDKTFFKLSELLTEDERYNLVQLLVNSGKKRPLMRLRHLPVEA